MKTRLLVILCLCGMISSLAVGDDTLEVAKAVAAENFKGFTYGSDVSKKQVNCVQFVGEVVARLLGRALSKAELDAIYIRDELPDLNSEVEAGNEKTKGVLFAFTKVLHCGTEVRSEDAKAGDFIQYWIKKKNGEWMGHSAILANVWKGSDGINRAAIYGANQSTNGIAETAFKNNEGLKLSGPDRRIYITRFRKP